MSENRSNVKEFLKDVFASIVGSAACVYTGQPFDTVKVRLQVNPSEFPGIFSCLNKTVVNEGVFALWRGSVPAFLGALSENAAAFGINGVLKRYLNHSSHSPTSLEEGIRVSDPLLTGAITGFCVSFVLCPYDMIKCRAQVNIAKGVLHQSVAEIVREVLRTRGSMGLYTGFSAQVLRDIPFYSTFFGSYEIMCQIMQKYTNLPDTSIYFIAGGLAGQIGWIASIAPDTVKSTVQTHPDLDRIPSVFSVSRDIYRQRGFGGFFLGLEVAVLRAFPANAALFLGYEFSKKAMEKW